MYIISVNYTSSLERIDSLLAEHIAFLKVHYEKKVFIASGRKVPRTGGVILARAKNRAELDAIIEQDPFFMHGVATYKVTEFLPTMALPEFADLKEP
ncbi:MAG TPA: GTP cyclohydrolase [Desulfobulbus sp.]|nr:GTP cyclohydrolase [Desulfobulbus sp.]